jgi:hypothetical protein
MNDAWIIVPSGVTLDDLLSALSRLEVAVPSIRLQSKQLTISGREPLPSGSPSPDDWIEVEDPETVAELQADDPNAVRSVVRDPTFYALRYHGSRVATDVLRTLANSSIADGPMLIRASGSFWTPREFQRRLEQDPEWWSWQPTQQIQGS